MPDLRDHDRRLIGFAREMRKVPSEAERRKWSLLRRRQLDGHYFRRQVPIEVFVADFVCVDCKLVVEVDGSQHFSGDEQRRYDEARTAVFARLGLRVLRFEAWIVLKESVAVGRTILRELNAADPLASKPPP